MPIILALPIQLLVIILAYGWPLLIFYYPIKLKIEYPVDSCCWFVVLMIILLAGVICIYIFLFPHLYSFNQIWFIDHLYWRGQKLF